jgi:hypothetical protein
MGTFTELAVYATFVLPSRCCNGAGTWQIRALFKASQKN